MRAGSSRTVILLFTLALSLLTAARAEAVNCSDAPYLGVIDGDIFPSPPSQIQIDANCTIRDYPASNPLTTNFSFYQPSSNPGPWLIIFDNVVHTGNMACNAVAGHHIWFTNGSSSSIQSGCQNLLIPVEKIDKKNPDGQTTAAIGVPFTYSLTIPILYQPGTGIILDEFGSPNELHSVIVWDDLNATGVDLTYLSHVAYWKSSGDPVPHTFTNVSGLLTFDLDPIIPAEAQLVIEITVVLEDTAANAPGTQFVNTAKWEFGRLIDDVFYQPLPGEWGISDPLTIAAPDLVMTKTGPATLGLTLNLGQYGTFTLDTRNNGLTDAWDVTILDELPDSPTGGMCDFAPEILNAQVFEADGTTPVPGKGPLVPGTDFSVSYAGAPTCELTLTMLTAAAVIGPGERLIITYRTKLDADSQDGVTLTNVAGATEWFNDAVGNPGRVTFSRTLTDGTVGVADHQDAHTVTVQLFGYFFEKSVENFTTGVNPTATAAPGDTLRYTLRLQTTDVPLTDLVFYDEMGLLNGSAVFVPGTLNVVSAPGGADTSNTDPSGGSNSAGILDVRNLSVAANSQIEVQFDIQVDPGLTDGTVILNQADLINSLSGSDLADSDDPNINGQADPSVDGDEDPTQVVIATNPVVPLLKANTQATATIGETFSYQITVPETPLAFPIYDVRITDDLTTSAADLRFLGVTKISGSGPWTPVNTGTDTDIVIEDTSVGIDIPAGEQVTVEISVILEDTGANSAPLPFSNTANYTYNRIDEDDLTELPGYPGTTPPMTIVEPDLTMTKGGPATITIGTPETFTLDVQNAGDSPAWNATLVDQLPDGATGGMCDVAPTGVTAQVFESDGTTPVSGLLSAGSDYSVAFSGAPDCELTLSVLSAAGTIGPGERLIVTYQAQLDAGTQSGATLTNVAGATEWFSLDSSATERRTYTEVLTDGTVGTLDHEDAYTVPVGFPDFLFEKTVANVTSNANPATTAAPGDVLHYTLRLTNSSDVPMQDLAFVDDLGSLNAIPVFQPGTLNLVNVPGGADVTGTDANGGTNGTGLLDVRNLSLPGAGQIVIEFEITLASPLVDGTTVTNQSQLSVGGIPFTVSDDPNVNGAADPFTPGDEDPTVVTIQLPPAGALEKANTQATASIGETFSYQITVPATAFAFDLYDVKITDDLLASAAQLRFVGVTKIFGSEPWTPVNTGTDTNLVIEDTSIGIDIPAGEQAVIEISVVVEDAAGNAAPLPFSNTAEFSYRTIDGDPASEEPGDSGTSPPMTIVEPDLTMTKSGPASMTLGTPETFTLNVQNTGSGPAWNVTLSDQLPDGATGGMCDAAPTAITAQVFESNGTTPVSGVLAAGSDYTVAFSGAPDCELTLTVLTAAGTIGPSQRLIVSYQTELDADTQNGVALTNVAGAVEWFSFDDSSTDRRTYTEVLTDGTVGTVDHEDAHTVNTALPNYIFEKTVRNLTSGANPATTAVPGDVLRYTLRFQNTTDTPLSGLSVYDEMDALNSPPTFLPGSLLLQSFPVGADTSNTDPNGGANGTGVLDIRNMSLAGAGQIVVVFDITLAPVIANGTLVTNQAQLLIDGVSFALSDDPTNGQADPFVSGDEDPTQVLIQSAPDFLVEKVSAYVTGDPAVLLAGETLRYTITVKNVGTADAVDATLRDAVPVNTQYVPGSTTLNGVAVPDGPGGTSPLSAGIPIHAPEDPTPGAMRADASATPDNVATLVFDVVVDPGVADGTVISNQAFVSAISGGVADQPSDDPRTSIPDDPTRDVVGSVPLLFATKSVELLPAGDGGSVGIVDPGDTLHYTITIYNNGAVPATGVVLSDAVPANTTYVAGSTLLNNEPVPDGGSSPLTVGVPISSSDLTPPLPGAGEGTLSPGASAVLEFDLTVDLGTPSGTIISNQAVVATNELPNLPTDGDGNPATGPEPTVVVVGDGQQLSITKTVTVVGGGAALAGSELEYEVLVRNIGAVPASYVVISDDLDTPTAGQLAYVASSATLNGFTTGVTVVGSVITADYSGSYGDLPSGQTVVLRFRAVIDAGLPNGTTVTNVGVVTWNDPQQMAMASVSVDVGGVPGVGVLNGTVWHDADFDRTVGSGERLLEGWVVELYRNGLLVQSVMTDASGAYSLGSVEPNDVSGDAIELRFRAPGAGPNTAALGRADSPFTDGLQSITDIVVPSGSSLQGLNLPIDPNGVVYDSVARTPIAGATLTLLSASGGMALPGTCFDDPVQQGQVTGADGYYKFDLNFDVDAACPSGGSYLIALTAPGATYASSYSQIIPPVNDPAGTPFSVPGCLNGPDDAVPATLDHCEVQVSEFPPDTSVAARTAGTNYHVLLTLDGSQMPGSSQIFNNHIPVDPVLDGAVVITKTTPAVNVSRGQLVPYEIGFSNELGIDLQDLNIVDRYPAGFKYVEGSARIDGVPVEPTVDGQELVWTDLGVASTGRRNIRLLLAVGAGVTEGEYVNRAQAVNGLTGGAVSGEATATVRVVPDPTFACSDVLGKVFDDKNGNGVQDLGERGLPGVRLVTARGLAATTDAHGRYHITCASTPNEERGSNFVLKLDDRTLPSGYRMSTRQVQVQRATRGKALRFNFGASVHRVVSLDMADAVFEPGSTEMRAQWRPRLELLLQELQKAPATLRLSYIADVEDEDLVEARLDAVKDEIREAWEALDAYELTIEPEVFWRRGAPLEDPGVDVRSSR